MRSSLRPRDYTPQLRKLTRFAESIRDQDNAYSIEAWFEEREQLLSVLAERGDVMLPTLLRALRGNRELDDACLDLLPLLPPSPRTVEALRRLARHRRKKVRFTARSRLRVLFPEPFFTDEVHTVRDQAALARAHAVDALHTAKLVALAERGLEVAVSESPRDRDGRLNAYENAQRLLSGRGDRILPLLVHVLEDDWLVVSALDVLSGLRGSAAVTEALRGLTTHARPEVRRVACERLAALGGVDDVEVLRPRLSDAPEVAAAALRALFAVAKDEGLVAAEALHGAAVEVRIALAHGLADHGGGEQEEWLARLSLDPNREVRVESWRGLGRLAPERLHAIASARLAETDDTQARLDGAAARAGLLCLGRGRDGRLLLLDLCEAGPGLLAGHRFATRRFVLEELADRVGAPEVLGFLARPVPLTPEQLRSQLPGFSGRALTRDVRALVRADEAGLADVEDVVAVVADVLATGTAAESELAVDLARRHPDARLVQPLATAVHDIQHVDLALRPFGDAALDALQAAYTTHPNQAWVIAKRLEALGAVEHILALVRSTDTPNRPGLFGALLRLDRADVLLKIARNRRDPDHNRAILDGVAAGIDGLDPSLRAGALRRWVKQQGEESRKKYGTPPPKQPKRRKRRKASSELETEAPPEDKPKPSPDFTSGLQQILDEQEAGKPVDEWDAGGDPFGGVGYMFDSVATERRLLAKGDALIPTLLFHFHDFRYGAACRDLLGRLERTAAVELALRSLLDTGSQSDRAWARKQLGIPEPPPAPRPPPRPKPAPPPKPDPPEPGSHADFVRRLEGICDDAERAGDAFSGHLYGAGIEAARAALIREGDAVVPTLVELLREGRLVDLSSFILTSVSGTPLVREALRELLDHSDPAVGVAATKRLGELAKEACFEELASRLEGEPKRVAAGVAALLRMNAERALPVVARFTAGPPEVREALAVAASEAETAAVVPVLQALLDDDVRAVRRACHRGLRRLDPEAWLAWAQGRLERAQHPLARRDLIAAGAGVKVRRPPRGRPSFEDLGDALLPTLVGLPFDARAFVVCALVPHGASSRLASVLFSGPQLTGTVGRRRLESVIGHSLREAWWLVGRRSTYQDKLLFQAGYGDVDEILEVLRAVLLSSSTASEVEHALEIAELVQDRRVMKLLAASRSGWGPERHARLLDRYGKPALSALLAAMTKGSISTGIAAQRLRHLRVEGAREALETLAQDRSIERRRVVLELLGARGPSEVLSRLARDPDDPHRHFAALAAAPHEPPEEVASLLLLQATDDQLFYWDKALERLCSLGWQDVRVFEGLEALARSTEDEDVLERVIQALKRIPAEDEVADRTLAYLAEGPVWRCRTSARFAIRLRPARWSRSRPK